MASRLFGGTDPTGKQLKLINPEQSDVWRTIVGVVSDIKYSGLDDPGTASVYSPFEQTPFLWSYILIRTSSDAATLMPGIREAFSSVDRNALPRRVQYVNELISDSVAQPRFNTSLLLCFAVLAMALAATGLYGVISYSVTQQTRDIGIRIALGAGTRNIFGYTMRSAAMLTMTGITIGIAGAWAASRLLASLLYNISATDPLTYMSVALILAAVSAVASYFPARRAARVDPIVALRHE
jgi:putative ABC transport system permease protein